MPFRKRQQILNGVKNPNAKEVRVSIVFTRLGEIDTINERFSCEATLFITWRESTSILQKCVDPPDAATAAALSSSNVVAGADSNSYYWDASKLWDPQLYIDNAIGDVKEKDVKFRLEKLFDENKKEWYFEVHMIKRIQGTFFEKLELYHFPFDVQDLSVTLTSHRTVDEIVLIQDFNIPPKMTKSASLDKHIWKLYDHVNIKAHTIRNDLPPTSEYSSEEFEIACSHSALTMQCRVSRKPGYFIINCLLPTLMITLCVFFTFMMDYQRFQYRFSLLFTTMLTSITFRWAIHGRVLPTISYMTFLDVYCVSSIMIVFSAMVWHATYLVIYKQDSVLAERCDLYAMITFAIVVILIHIMQTFWFIVAFKKRYELEQLDKKAALSYLKARMSVAQNANNKLNRAAAVNKANNVTDPLLPPPPPPSQPHDDIFNAESKIEEQTSNKNSSSVKSKRMLYSQSKQDESELTNNESNQVTSSTSNPNMMPNIDENGNHLTRNESNMTCASTVTGSSNNNNNLLLISKSSSFGPNNMASTPNDMLPPNYDANNIALIASPAITKHPKIKSHNYHHQYSSLHHQHSRHHHHSHHQHQHQQQPPPPQQQEHHQHMHHPTLPIARLNVAGHISHSLDYQYIPLIHQSSRDS